MRGIRVALIGCVVTGVLATPSVAAAWNIWVTPRVVRQGGNVTVHKSTRRRCAVTVGGDHGHMRRSLRLHVGGQARPGRVAVTVTCGEYYSRTSFTVRKRKTSAPTQSPGPTTDLPPLTPWTTGAQQISTNTEDMTPGDETCFLGQVSVDSPTIGAPTGTWVYARDALFTEPPGSTAWSLADYGPLYYNGTHRAVFLWYDINNNAGAPQSDLDTFDVPAGDEASIIQYIWDGGIWYQSDGPACTP